MAKEFHLGDVLTVTHERLVAPEGIGGVYKILNYITGDNLFTHQLPRAARLCKPEILRQHPFLADPAITAQVDRLGELCDEAEDTKGIVEAWLAGMVLKYREHLSLEPMRPADYEAIDPMEELETMVGKDRIIKIQVE